MELVERAADGIASAMEAVLPFSLGWLDDVFQLTVYFDASLAGAPSDAAGAGAGDNGEAAEPPAAVFCAGAPVRGFVRITAPPGRRVGHAGVSAVLGAALVTAEAAPAGGGAAAAAAGAGLSRTLFELSQTLAPAGEIEGSVDVPFSFAGAATAALPESYEGALFCLRARLAVTVARPWWTFEVAREAPLLVQRLYELPARASYALELSSAGELSSALVASAEHGEKIGLA